MKHLALISAIALAGCSVDNNSQNDYLNSQHDASTNLTLLPSSELWIDFNTIVRLHKEMQACLGLSINPATDETVIAWRSFKETSPQWFGAQLGAGWGVHFRRAGVSNVYINTDLDKSPYIYQGFDRDVYTDVQTVKHEFIHSILYHTTGNGDAGHSNDAYTRCDAWTNTYN